MSNPAALTVSRIEAATCPADKQQAFLIDKTVPGLKLRVTSGGAKSFVFEARAKGSNTKRYTIGDASSWTLGAARAEARRMRVLMDQGIDPKQEAREQYAQAVQEQNERARELLTVGALWDAYLKERKPFWGERSYIDHCQVVTPGGEVRKRIPNKTTIPGPLYPLMGLRLAELDAKTIEALAKREAPTRPARLRLSLRLLKGFLNWAAAEGHELDSGAILSRKAREIAGPPGVKDDALERGQLATWFTAVKAITNPAVHAYLQVLLLTGARPGEVLTLRWEDVGFPWKTLTIRDKVEGERTIPLTPYVAHLLSALPKRNDWCFTNPSGKMPINASALHRRACASAGLEGLTLHGLRRSFSTLTEWLETPAGVVAQIQGHKPSATAEKHYKRRPVDLLRVHHERIEAWILEQAGVQFTPAKPLKLSVVG
jgi:integrase